MRKAFQEEKKEKKEKRKSSIKNLRQNVMLNKMPCLRKEIASK